MHKLILASQSPRRKHILTEQGFEFRTLPIEVSEIPDKNLNLIEQISDLAKQKVVAAQKSLNLLKSQDILVLGADTVVVFEGEILGKPQSRAQAIETLSRLSGKKHQVITGFCFLDLGPERFILGHGLSDVEFRSLTDEEIKGYVASGDPMDKAGSYGIQGEAKKFVKKYSGSFNNIVGLPIEKVLKVIDENGWKIKRKS